MVLHGLTKQTDSNFEVVVADDGSDERTAAVVESYYKRLPITHVWHEHRGWRLAEIRNRGILASRGGYCIFLDGDCIPRPRFVAAHRRLAEPGWWVQGNRVNLREKFSKHVLANKIAVGEWSLSRWWTHRWRHHVSRTNPLVTLPLGSLRKRTPQFGEKALGCNQGTWRRDLDRVDGFDGVYTGWGWEDGDIGQRLINAGVGRKSGHYATAVIHLWHDPAHTREARKQFDYVVENRIIRARHGMSVIRPHAQAAE